MQIQSEADAELAAETAAIKRIAEIDADLGRYKNAAPWRELDLAVERRRRSDFTVNLR